MTDLPSSKISAEMVDAYVRAIFTDWYIEMKGEELRQDVRAGLAAALVASGWRPEADVLREAADGLLECHYELSRVTVATFAEWLRLRADKLTRDQATALEPAQPLPVADGSEAHCATGSCRGNPVTVLGGEFRCARCAEVILARSGSRG